MNRGIIYVSSLISSCVIIILMVSLGSCRWTRDSKNEAYLQDPKISDQTGNPKDSSIFYLPMDMKFSDSELNNGMDPFLSKWMSSMLYFLKEPVLYNKYLGKDIFRLFWLFDRPVVISLIKENNKVILNTKILNHVLNPNKPGTTVIIDEPRLEHTSPNSSDWFYHYNISYAEVPPLKIILNKTQVLSEKEWDNFKSKLDSLNFYNEYPWMNDGHGYAGYSQDAVLESHSKDGYWLMHRKDGDYEFWQCCKYLIKLSSIQDYGIKMDTHN